MNLIPTALANASLEVAVMHKRHSSTTGHVKLYLQMICHQPLFAPEDPLCPPAPATAAVGAEGKSDFGRGGIALLCSSWGHSPSLATSWSYHRVPHPVLAMAEGSAHCRQCAWGFALPPAACANRRPDRQAGDPAWGWHSSRHSAPADLQMGWLYFSWILLPY